MPALRIGDLEINPPIIQGGMSIRISGGRLAGAVAATGAVGVIGASGLEHEELANEIRTARNLAKGGRVGMNSLDAASDFLGIVKTAIRERIDFITSGAGFSRDLFRLGQEGNIPIVPIVSSGKLARIAEGLGAAAIVAESKEAGGHLGTLEKGTDELLKEVKAAVNNVPIIAAGGLANGQDVARVLTLGANGAQLATRFILAEECGGAKEYKEVHARTTDPNEVILIKSPVGMPGRAIRTKLTDDMIKGQYPSIPYCDDCLKVCSKQYCIFDVLKKAQKGDMEGGLVFSGESVTRIKDKLIRPAAEIINQLVKEAEACYAGT